MWFKCCTRICGLLKVGICYNLPSFSAIYSPYIDVTIAGSVVSHKVYLAFFFLLCLFHNSVCTITYVNSILYTSIILYNSNVCYCFADKKKAPSKENKHRALDDIRESIKELKYYKQNIFKAIRNWYTESFKAFGLLIEVWFENTTTWQLL